MKQEWENIGTEIHNVKQELENLLEMLPQSAKIHKQVNALNKVWKRLQKSIGDFDAFVMPVKSVKVSSPLLEDPDFRKAWQNWKEYLSEQHGIVMRSRAELEALKRMGLYTDDKPEPAIKYLSFAISRMDKNFYVVKNDPLFMGEPEEKETKKTGISLPPQYSNSVHRSNSSPPAGGEVPSAKRDGEVKGGEVKQKTLQEEINEFKQSKRKK